VNQRIIRVENSLTRLVLVGSNMYWYQVGINLTWGNRYLISGNDLIIRVEKALTGRLIVSDLGSIIRVPGAAWLGP